MRSSPSSGTPLQFVAPVDPVPRPLGGRAVPFDLRARDPVRAARAGQVQAALVDRRVDRLAGQPEGRGRLGHGQQLIARRRGHGTPRHIIGALPIIW